MATDPGTQPTTPETPQLAHERRGRDGDGVEPGGSYGFFTDTTVCIGCKACEVACKQWNQLPDDGYELTGHSYDNTGELGASTWRHVAFVERTTDTGLVGMEWFDNGVRGGIAAELAEQVEAAGGEVPDRPLDWLMLSDVCKHCTSAACLNVCPTGALIRTEYDTVYLQPDVCNGCGMCVPACPFGVVDRREEDGRAFKCTLCYDRLRDDLEPACAKACPTDSIVFGEVDELRGLAEERVATLHERGVDDAYLYGADADDQPGTGGLNAFFLLRDEPEVYNLPPDPVDATLELGSVWRTALAAGAGVLAAAAAVVGFLGRGEVAGDPAGRR